MLTESEPVQETAMSKRKTAKMTSKEYRATIEKLGLSQIPAGSILGLSPRQSQRLANNEAPVPRPIAKLLNLITKRKVTLEDVDNAG